MGTPPCTGGQGKPHGGNDTWAEMEKAEEGGLGAAGGDTAVARTWCVQGTATFPPLLEHCQRLVCSSMEAAAQSPAQVRHSGTV